MVWRGLGATRGGDWPSHEEGGLRWGGVGELEEDGDVTLG